MAKYLILRFSSIGDIVLTTPVIRCIKEQQKGAEIHFATKEQYAHLLSSNPHLSKIISLKPEAWGTFLKEVKRENYDYIIDLHNNLRTKNLKIRLRGKKYAFPKLNYKKWLLVNFKINKMPDLHVVDRYFNTVEPLGIINDNKGIDFHIPDYVTHKSDFPEKGSYSVYCIGGQFTTKKMPWKKIAELCNRSTEKIILIGGEEDRATAQKIVNEVGMEKTASFCGEINIFESALLVKHAKKVFTHDTGMMHIASAFDTPIVSIWGNTTPDFGMYPYRKENVHLIQKDVSCRPCSKIGFQQCPKKHFKCMDHDVEKIVDLRF